MNKDYEQLPNNSKNIDPSMFEFVQRETKINDKKIATKRIGYFKDAMIRFSRNKASVVASCIILLLFLFAIFGPILGSNAYTKSKNDLNSKYYAKLLPKINDNVGSGFWDGTTTEEVNFDKLKRYEAIGAETGLNPVAKIVKEFDKNNVHYYKIRKDSYANLGVMYIAATAEEYKALQQYQDENNIQIIYPAIDLTKYVAQQKDNANLWYQHDKKGNPILDSSGNFINIYSTANINDEYTSKMRIEGDTGEYKYARFSGTASYILRVSTYKYFIYLYGFEPSFIFGSDKSGLDIFTRLSDGARLSFLLAFFVASINLVIGAIWGSIAGYFGGTTDLVMERITDILGNVPFMIVTTLFQLHLAAKVGPIVSLLFAFVLTGWIGTASTVRMQFYRYKNQEYILAARTLGAKNSRLMFKHIFPNALGTIITSSVLVIPSVIFSESSLTYLGIVNLESAEQTSVGTMLAHGRDQLQYFPHIILFPALFISLLMITFNLFGNGLRDAFNPSLRGSED